MTREETAMLATYKLYKGQVVSVTPCDRSSFDIAVLDAKRIMGLAKVKPHYKWDHDGKYAQYLEPPEEDSGNWEYATRILSLQWPVVRIFLNGSRIMVSASDLEPINQTVVA